MVQVDGSGTTPELDRLTAMAYDARGNLTGITNAATDTVEIRASDLHREHWLRAR